MSATDLQTPIIEGAIRSTNFFNGRLLSARDLTLEQSAYREADRRLGKAIGEGIAYGSSLINYTISGAPVSVFRVELSDEYFNVEFTGKDIRNWQRTEGGYLVQLHTPVSGAYTLLTSYERPFKVQGETLTFAGARRSSQPLTREASP